jgi:hypothetical protein
MNDTSLPSDSAALSAYKAAQQQSAGARETLLQSLRALRADTVVVTYDGCGDSGQIEEIDCFDADNKAITTTPDIEAGLQDLLYRVLDMRHGGCFNNDGAFGTFTWCLVTDSLEHEHNDRFTDYETSFYEGFGDTGQVDTDGGAQ